MVYNRLSKRLSGREPISNMHVFVQEAAKIQASLRGGRNLSLFFLVSPVLICRWHDPSSSLFIPPFAVFQLGSNEESDIHREEYEPWINCLVKHGMA